MHVIEVIPLKKGVGIESLSYYSATPYEVGSIIEMPVRNKTISGVVAATKTVSTAKTALRTATFSLKKLPPQTTKQRFPNTLITTAKKLTDVVPARLGAVLHSLTPPDIRNGIRPYPQLPEHLEGELIPPAVITAPQDDRYIAYRSHVREAFAHRGSVVFVVPTSAAVEQAEMLLKKGIENRVITFSSTHTKKKLDDSYAAFEDLRQAKLVITTPNFAFLCRHDITSIIVENAGSPYYVARSRPYLDARDTLKIFASVIGVELIYGDNVPPAEIEVARREERYTTFEEHTQRLQLPGTINVAEHPKESLNFSLITDKLKNTIDLHLANRGRIFLYASRRGLAPVVVCKDCGHIFTCKESGAPYSLLRTGTGDQEKRWFYCGTSGARVPAADICPDCGSWRLFEQGIGIQQVHDVITGLYPGTTTVLMDHLTASTHAKAKKLIAEFYKDKRSILIGTNLALPYLQKPIDCTGVISYEAMRSVPTWRADESVFQTLLTLREITLKDVVVQTRSGSDELLQLATRGLVDQFYDGEIAVRKALGYPPYAIFILLTYVGTKEQVAQSEAYIEKTLQGYDVQFYNGPLSQPKKTIRHGLLRIPVEQYPSPALIDKLNTLPPYVKVEINPAKII